MGKTNEFTLIAKADYSAKVGHAVLVDNTLSGKNAVGVLATAAGAIDGIITDVMAGGAGAPIAVAKVGDIVFAKIGGAVTVGASLEVDANAALVTKTSGVEVAKALATGASGELIPVLIK